MSEAVKPIIDIAFRRDEVLLVAAATFPANEGSKNILRKAGLKFLGLFPRIEHGYRGPAEVTRWELTREDYKKSARPT